MLKNPTCSYLAFSLVCAALFFDSLQAGTEKNADVVVYGGTAAGVMAAIQAQRSGLKAVLVSPEQRLGGMTTGGLGATDIGSKKSVTGLASEFYRRIFDTYLDPSRWKYETRTDFISQHPDTVSEDLKMQWFFEPKVALEVLEQMLAETKVEVLKDVDLAQGGVVKSGARITGLKLSNGSELKAKMFIDASYEGDLMAGAGVTYATGREASSEFGEDLNGIVVNDRKKIGSISPFIVPGAASSGLLPLVEAKRPGADGEGDHRVQAYNFRLCLTDVEENRIPVEKPKNYNPMLYELAARWILAHPSARPGKSLFKLTPMPNRKTDSNNQGPFSTDFVGMSYDYAEADHSKRSELIQAHRDYIQGFIWFLGNDPRLPAELRAEVLKWGFPKDEFVENGGWPTQLYVREGRRMRGEYVVTQNDAEKKTVAQDPVALASYAMDSHSVSRFAAEDGLLSIEGAFWRGIKPFGISYRAIVPKAKDCENLLVPVCLSSSHAAYGSIRMEPVFMMLAQAAAIGAAFAISDNIPVQDVPYAKLRQGLDVAGLSCEAGPAEIPSAKPSSKDMDKPSKSGSLDASALPEQSQDQESLDAADLLKQLQEAGVIAHAEDWQPYFEERRPCPPQMVSEFLVAAGEKIGPVNDAESALELLAANKVIGNASFWLEYLHEQKPVPAQWIIDLSSKLLKWMQAR